MAPDRHLHHQPPAGVGKPAFPSPPLDGARGTIEPSLLQQRQARPPPSHSSSATSIESSQGWPPTPLEHPQLVHSSSSSSGRAVRPALVSSLSFPPVVGGNSSAHSSTSTIVRPRAGKERSSSFVGPPLSHKAKPRQTAATTTTTSAVVTRKKRAPEGQAAGSVVGPPPKVHTRKDGSNRTQYSSCGACRLRRVKCNLNDIKSNYQSSPHATALSLIDGELVSASGTVLKCDNCRERGLRCVDSYNPNLPAPPPIARSGLSFGSSSSSSSAPLSAKQDSVDHPDPTRPVKPKALRKGKRVLQVEDEFGAPPSYGGRWAAGTSRKIPELKKAFLSSEFYAAFHVQRPMLDPEDFARRFLVTDPPTAASLGPVGSILCHVLLAWAYSYGIDESGKEAPPPTTNEDRIKRRQKCNEIVNECLTEIDRYGVMRRPTWDGVRVLLMILPLTEDTSPPIERLAMYECAVGQVYSLCSIDTATYELGIDSSSTQARWGSDEDRPSFLVRARVYWYCYVHEAIKTGLKGGRLVMDEDDLEQFQASSDESHKRLIPSQNNFDAVARYATAPIRLAQACRMIHRALTGPKARRNERVNGDHLRSAWEALEACFEEFQAFRDGEGGNEIGILKTRDVERFCDGWQCFLFECHSVIREALADRITSLEQVVETGRLQAVGSGANEIRMASEDNLIDLRRLHAIAESKCYTLARLMILIVKRNLGSRFFAYDASLVRDGVYYASSILAVDGGSSADINACLSAFDEMRWAFSKTYERTEKIKSLWASSLDQAARQSGSIPSLSANLPYPLQPSGRTRSSDVHPTMPNTLQRMPSYNSEAYSPGPSDESPIEDGQARPPAALYATGLVSESGLGSNPTYRNRGSLAQSLGVTLKLEDNSPEGGVWALPPSTSSSSSLRGGSRSRGNSRGANSSLGSSPGEMRPWREEAHLEVTLASGHYQEATEEIEDGLGFALPSGGSSFPGATFVRQEEYTSEPMSTGPSFEGYTSNPSLPVNRLAAPDLFDDPSYVGAQLQSGVESYSYPALGESYPVYPTGNPPVQVQRYMAEPETVRHRPRPSPYQSQLSHFDSSRRVSGPITPAESPQQSQPIYGYSDGPAYQPPASTSANRQPVLAPVYQYPTYQSQPNSAPTRIDPYENYDSAPAPAPLQYSDAYAERAPYPTYAVQPPMETLDPAEGMYDGEMIDVAYYGTRQGQVDPYEAAGGRAGPSGASLMEEGYTSSFPRHA